MGTMGGRFSPRFVCRPAGRVVVVVVVSVAAVTKLQVMEADSSLHHKGKASDLVLRCRGRHTLLHQWSSENCICSGDISRGPGDGARGTKPLGRAAAVDCCEMWGPAVLGFSSHSCAAGKGWQLTDGRHRGWITRRRRGWEMAAQREYSGLAMRIYTASRLAA